MRTSLVVGAVLLGVGAVLVAACVKGDECDFGGCSGPTADGGNDGPSSDAPGIDAPPGCDLTKGPSESPACVDDSVGVFVSASGDDGATGKKAAPVKTIGKGLELAAASGLPRVYVCEGSYDTAAEIKTPIAMYGGLSCAWAYTGNKPKLAPPKGIALRVTSVSGAVLVQDLEVDGAADAATPGDSAIAAFVSQSNNVTFTNVTLGAGAGTAGGPGTTSTNYTGTTAPAGNVATGTTGGKGAGPCNCTDGTKSAGGNGADGVNGAGSIPTDGSATPAVGVSNAGTTGQGMCTPGNDGANGPAGAQTTPSADVGGVTSDGWIPSQAAAKAPNGRPAQGGGGGGGKILASAPGGGGGCGGCGGAGGSAGQPGGSSFSLASFQSSVSVIGGTLSSGAAGKGGKGGTGEAGQGGGAGAIVAACNGGSGGVGAGGSGGSGGAGGYSAAVLFSGSQPSVTSAMLSPGGPGVGGEAGDPGPSSGNAGASGVKGADGKSSPTLSL